MDKVTETREQRLAGIRERESKATKGPWNWRESEEYGREPQVWADHYPNGEFAATEGSRGWSICKTRPKSLTKHSVLWPFPFGEHGWEDGQFIAHARADIPYLLSALDSERERVLLEAAKVVCRHCRDEMPLFIHQHQGKFYKFACEAWAIHDLRSKEGSQNGKAE